MARASRDAGSQLRAYELKVTLQDIRPPVWRRFRVRDDLTLGQLHDLLQPIMGWTNSHLHQFEIDGTYFGPPNPEIPPHQDERRARLRDVLHKPGDGLIYEYDFGDGWEHLIALEAIAPHEAGTRYPIVLAGRRACPPEDCGGSPGYEHLLEVLRSPGHPEHDELLEWVGGSFDPEGFDVGALNLSFQAGSYLPPDEEKPRITRLRRGTARTGPAKRRQR